jgi:ser/thr/tyr protein kinase RAD53
VKINGEKIGRNKTAIVREGNEVAFGTCQPQDNLEQDYRTSSILLIAVSFAYLLIPGYIYRHMAAGVPKQGLWAFYDIAHELGKGSFATVVKAINRMDHQWYAVKMIQNANKMKRRHVPAGNGANPLPDGHLELSREIKILEGLNHRNICKLKEVFFDRDPENESICWFKFLDFVFLS